MSQSSGRYRGLLTAWALSTALLVPMAAHAAKAISGQVLDINGQPLRQAMVTLEKAAGQPGPTAVTVFTDADGRFELPGVTAPQTPTVRLLGYRTADTIRHRGPETPDFTILMRTDANQAGIAPASAWLKNIGDPNDKSTLVMTCVACHQMPAPEVRGYAKLVHDVPNISSKDASEQGWHAIVQYMLNVSGAEFGRVGILLPKDSRGAYAGGPLEPTTALLTRTLPGSLQEVSGYQYGAPILADAHTVIREYEVPRPNAVREALTLDDPGILWMADVSSNRLFRVDMTTGAWRTLEIPVARPYGPHTLVRDKAGALWATSFAAGMVAKLDPKTEKIQAWTLNLPGGGMPGIHDLSFGTDHELLTDKHGRVWYSDILDNAIGWFSPKSGEAKTYPIPPVPGRVGNEQVYGLAMSADTVHVWYAQLGIGTFGSFNTETLQYETSVQLADKNAGPRRISISDSGVLYLALYGTGQLAAYDTHAQKMIGIYDLPDRASAPYSTTWDPVRKVVWIPTSNANVIYRFDPRDNAIAVLPLPREGAFLRMVGVDKHTGALVTAYANIVDSSRGPRMGVVIDLGDTPAPTALSSAARRDKSDAK